ncbi:hypothetical protein O6H91_16G074000 [Diphasiastrum complanatum]|uniref:Uncharacterized protein n=1 Tax=Diphasiastrum complanatum TaxID=34168 RepID=A0ACC2BDU5_DIPCM|nr:hypothetical protein O6H91_16G074000 [Diphasiastrum complanatum]
MVSLRINEEENEPQIELVYLLFAGAEAVEEENVEMAYSILERLISMSAIDGSPMQRLGSYFAETFAARLTSNNSSHLFQGLTPFRNFNSHAYEETEMLEAFAAMHELIPIGRFVHFTMNQVLLDAVEEQKFIHLIDFQVWYGSQWPAFLQSLALRPSGPPMRVRMTAIGSSLKELEENGRKLLEYAREMGISFKYHPLVTELHDFKASMIEMRRDEVCLINSLGVFHRLLHGGSEIFHELLCNLKSDVRPKLLVMSETDGNHNGSSFKHRFVECLRFYAAIFDVFDATLPQTSLTRIQLEHLFAGQKIRNIISCEGAARVERHENMQSWSMRMHAAQFNRYFISSRAVNQANHLLEIYKATSDGYTSTYSDGALILGWRNMPLVHVSAWS